MQMVSQCSHLHDTTDVTAIKAARVENSYIIEINRSYVIAYCGIQILRICRQQQQAMFVCNGSTMDATTWHGGSVRVANVREEQLRQMKAYCDTDDRLIEECLTNAVAAALDDSTIIQLGTFESHTLSSGTYLRKLDQFKCRTLLGRWILVPRNSPPYPCSLM